MNTYSILHPNKVTATRTDEGHFSTLVFTDREGYVNLNVVKNLAKEGRITIHEIGGNELAESYGRTRVVYSIN